VLRAGGGAEGIALARSNRPDLLLLDLMMPDVDGFQVVATLKADPATRDIPIVILTAKNLTQEDKRVLNGHVVAVLQKGTAAGVELVTWLDELMRRLGVGAQAR
jgi:CheY-like chemotaxis protein